jgi:hypothetical protein
MKKYAFLLLALGVLNMKICSAQQNQDSLATLQSPSTEEFKPVLSDTYASFDTARSVMEMQSASNKLGLIAKKWPNEWATQYYACFSLVILSYIEKDGTKRDAYLDEADKLYSNASGLINGENDELYVLGALMANARIAVSPMNRYPKFGEIFNTDIDKAKKLRPENPRIYYLLGTSFYYTPKAFGGGAKNSISYFEKADGLYQNEKQDDILKPYWGKKQNSDLLAKCREEIK